jgi:tRNA-dihydrouridine synthase A
MIPYIERELKQGSLLKHITRHMLGLFQGTPGARHWRRYLSENAPRADAGADVVLEALQKLADARDKDLPTNRYTRNMAEKHG